jgi:hypothetical protein
LKEAYGQKALVEIPEKLVKDATPEASFGCPSNHLHNDARAETHWQRMPLLEYLTMDVSTLPTLSGTRKPPSIFYMVGLRRKI